ncbi:MAG: hypothetical protein H6Q70_1872 [Firmicutes bacterium]|nr:hypothetical protein [Bacillota bacterium]
MENENIEVRDWNDYCPEKKHGCIINIFCCDKGQNCESDYKKEGDNCIINIFCDGKKTRKNLSTESVDK